MDLSCDLIRRINLEVPAASSENPPSSRTSHFYRPELDVLRLLAFLLVFCRHVLPISHSGLGLLALAGDSGVCLFFLLSAFLITELLEREVRVSGGINLPFFFARRILRIWPVYFLAIAIAAVIDSGTGQMGWGRVASCLLFSGNWYWYFFGMPASFATVLWSVSVEEQFYFLWPSVRKWMGRRALALTGTLTIPVSFATVYSLHTRPVWFNTFAQAMFFGLGGLLSLILRGRAPSWPVWFRLSVAATGILLFVGAFLSPTTSARAAVWQYLELAVGAITIFMAFLGWAHLGRWKFGVYLGQISYGLYVYHLLAYRMAFRPAFYLYAHHYSFLVVQTFCACTTFALTVLLAHLSYAHYELFFLRFKEQFAIVKTRPHEQRLTP